MNNIRKNWLLLAVLVGVGVIGGAIYLATVVFKSDPCKTETEDVLIERYPQLKDLKESQTMMTEKLLEIQRQQDVTVNIRMGHEDITADQALQLSLIQADQLAALRKRQHEEFNRVCREVVAGKK
jgi:flagellar basal body-associated protein FliL